MRRWILALALCAPVLGQVKLPPYTREALPNGAVAYYVQKAGLPLVNFRVLVKGGMESDPADMAGLAAVTAELLRRGTAGRTAAQVSDEMDGLGGTFNAMVDEQSTAIAAEFLAKDFDRGLALVADAVLTPAFPEEEVRKALARRIDGIRTIKDNPGRAIDSYYRSFFFGNRHPYGRVADEVSLAKIQRDAVVNYHKRMYVGRNLIVIVAGNFDLAAAKTVVTRSFGAVAAGTGYNWVEDRPPAAAGPRVLLVDKPDATQTYFVIARPGVRRSTPDRAALTLVNTLVGGRFTSMLNEELRVNSGLTYGARSQAEMDRLTGAIYIST
jgi:zinc protease